MAIFSRRTLQRLINENATFLKREQSLKLIENLNRFDESSLGFEWEVVLINVFSKFGNVEYEPDLGGARRPDLKFKSSREGISFVADIVTISDRSEKKRNPCDDFHDELMRLVKKYGLKQNAFSVEIGKENEGSLRNRKIKLKLPMKSEFGRFFNADFKFYLNEIAKTPLSPKNFSIRTGSVEVSIKYNPAQQFATMNYASYATPYSLTRNPLYNRLKDKTDQLKETNYDGPKAIFICDGGCASLRNDGYAGLSYSTSQIIYNFLRQHTSISFVLLFTMQLDPYTIRKGPIVGKIQLFKNTAARKKVDFESTNIAQEIHKVFPLPVNDTINAINQFDKSKKRKSCPFYGGLHMTEKAIKISARALLELLAGKIEPKKFFEDYKFFDSITSGNYFANKLREGRLIHNIRLEKTEEDDDWITIEFGEKDPAISKFMLKEEGNL